MGGTKNPSIDDIVAFDPDLVVVDREENRLDDAAALARAGLGLFVSDVRSVDDATGVVADLARVVGAPPPPAETATPAPVVARTRSVLVPIWRRPWMTIGPHTYGASVLDRIGLDTGDWGSGDYPTFTLELLALRAPAVIAVPSEPYDFSESHVDELRRASPSSRVVRVDGQDLFWWGTRTPAALARLALALG